MPPKEQDDWAKIIKTIMESMADEVWISHTSTGNTAKDLFQYPLVEEAIHADEPKQDPPAKPEPSNISITPADIDLELYDALGYVPKTKEK